MRKVQCGECGKRYDFDIDDFCPRCGAFNQPGRSSRIGPDGRVVRVDGINENTHAGSFVHQELHREDRIRRRMGLERSRSGAGSGKRDVREAYQAERKKKLPLAVRVILVIIAVNLLFNLGTAVLGWLFY